MDLNSLIVFNRVVESNSITKASESLNRTKQSVSHTISSLEKDLHVRFFERTTRKIRLTEIGKLFYEKSRKIEDDAKSAFELLEETKKEPCGTLRITSTHLFAEIFLEKVIINYLKKYPKSKIEMILDEKQVDLLKENIDLAIRMGNLEDSSMRFRKLGSINFICCATPEYLKNTPEINHPSSILSHECLVLKGQSNTTKWKFTKNDEEEIITPKFKLRINNQKILLNSTLNNLGISIMPYFLCNEYLDKGKLVRVLPEWKISDGEVNALFLDKKKSNINLRTFLEMIILEFKNIKI
ncbi:MAG: LysR family transcriptional regulator [Cyanobacteriota bacterium]